MGDCLRVSYLFLKFYLKRFSEWFFSILAIAVANLVSKSLACCNRYQHIVIKFLQCHGQPRAPRKRSVPSENDHPTIVEIFRKFNENGQCIQTISFRVTMVCSILNFVMYYNQQPINFFLAWYDFQSVCTVNIQCL